MELVDVDLSAWLKDAVSVLVYEGGCNAEEDILGVRGKSTALSFVLLLLAMFFLFGLLPVQIWGGGFISFRLGLRFEIFGFDPFCKFALFLFN